MPKITFTSAGGVTTDSTVSTPSLSLNGTTVSGIETNLTNTSSKVPASSAVYNFTLSRGFPTEKFMERTFDIAYQSGGTWYDNDVWWRVLKSTVVDSNYFQSYIEVVFYNKSYNHAASNASKYIIAPCYQGYGGGIVTVIGNTGSCHGCRCGRDANGIWYVDFLLRANTYCVQASGDSFDFVDPPLSKVSESGLSYIRRATNSWNEYGTFTASAVYGAVFN